MTATEPGALAKCVVDYLNGSGAATLVSMCADGVVVFAPIAEETIDPFAKRDASRLVEFVDAFRSAFPDIRFSLAGVEASAAAVTIRWTARGTHQRPLGYIQASGEAVAISGTCVLRIAGESITEIRLAADIYELLLQTGALCADPSQSRGQSRATNGSAMEALQRAIVGRSTDVAPPLDKGTVLHASIGFYGSGDLDQRVFHADGAGELSALLAYLREQFSSVELSMDDGLSQGYTTTFRGRAAVVREGEHYSYMFRCGFRAAGARIAESWVEMQVPPTLREVFE